MAIGILFLAAKEKNMYTFLCAIITYAIENYAVVLFVSFAHLLSIDIQSTLVFGISRIVFCVFLKSFVLFIFIILTVPLKKLSKILSNKANNVFSVILSTSLFCLSYVYGNSQGNDEFTYYSFFLTVIVGFSFYLFYMYCETANAFNESQFINTKLEMTKEQVETIDVEYTHYRKLKHDLNNQLSTLYNLQKEGHFKEVLSALEKLYEGVQRDEHIFTHNIYIDAILRQKIKQYPTINFKLEILVSNDFFFEGIDLISLTSNIIDNACEELQKIKEKDFYLTIKADATKLQLYASNQMHEGNTLTTSKDPRLHGFGLKIIQEIVNKYEGVMSIETKDNFIIKILIPL